MPEQTAGGSGMGSRKGGQNWIDHEKTDQLLVKGDWGDTLPKASCQRHKNAQGWGWGNRFH